MLTPVDDAFDDPMGGLITALFFTLMAGWALYRVGSPPGARARSGARHPGRRARRFRRNAHGARLARLPPVILAASGGTNDAVLSALIALALLCFYRERLAVLVLGVAAWVKIIPVLVLPSGWPGCPAAGRCRRSGCWPAQRGRSRRLVALGGTDAVPAMFKAMVFQMDRGSLRSLWVGSASVP